MTQLLKGLHLCRAYRLRTMTTFLTAFHFSLQEIESLQHIRQTQAAHTFAQELPHAGIPKPDQLSRSPARNEATLLGQGEGGESAR